MQRTLVFTREERVLLIEAARLTTRVSATLARRLKGLLLQLELTTGSQGCFPGQELLAAKLGTTKRTIGKWVELLRQLGIVKTEIRKTWAGRRQLDYHVEWSRLQTFCDEQSLKTIEEKLRIAPKNFASRCEAGSQRDANSVRRPYVFSSYKEEGAVVRSQESGSQGTEELLGLVKAVNACGVDRDLPAVNAALGVGCTADEIRAAIEHYRTLQGVTPGALYVKLMKMQPGEAANRRFPRGTGQPASPANRQRSLIEQQFSEQARTEADTAAAERRTRDRLEAIHGEELNAIPREEYRRLVEQTGSAGLLFEYLRNPSSAIVREALLRKFFAGPGEPLTAGTTERIRCNHEPG